MPQDVVREIGQHREGDEVEVVIQRDGEESEVKVRLQSLPIEITAHSINMENLNWEKGKVYGLGADGNVRVWNLEEGTIVPAPKAGPTRDSADLNYLLEHYQRAIRAPKPSGGVARTTVRVQRSEVEKKLDELTQRVMSLQSEVEKLTGELKTLGDKFNEY